MLCVARRASMRHHCAMQTTTNATHDAPRVDANVARYDDALARDIARRDHERAQHERERDARRRAYDVATRDMPLTLALRERLLARPTHSERAFLARAPRVHVDASMGTCDEHGRPWVGRFRCRTCDPTLNAWESRAPHARAHLARDPSCHHPLVRCAHKW